MQHKQKKFLSAIRVPEKKKGRWSVEHKLLRSGSEITVVSMRNAIFDGTGRAPKSFILDQDYYQHILGEQGNIWMTDSIQELEQMKFSVQDFRGRVLVGGLGLGVVLTMMPAEVEQIVVIEKSKEVAELVWPYTDQTKSELVISDLFYGLPPNAKFDYAFFDIWQPTGEMALQDFVIPLRKLYAPNVQQKNIRCWGEGEMWGQVRQGLETFVVMMHSDVWPQMKESFNNDTERWCKDDPIKAPFYRWFKQAQPSQDFALKHLQQLMKAYWSGDFGNPILMDFN